MKNTRIIFMGTPDFAVPVLEGLIENCEVILVVTQPDKLVGRKQELTYSPIKELAMDNHIEVFQPEKIREDYEQILELDADFIITCAYGQIIPKVVLDSPRIACINVHASLLPKLRGGAPIHHALIDGYSKTGVTIMYMDEKMDAGNIISQSEYVIKETDNVETLHDTLSLMGKYLLMDTLPAILEGTNKNVAQNEEEVTYGYNIKREEEHLDFNKNCRDIFNRVRGLNPWPKANMILDGEEVKVLECYYEVRTHNYELSTIFDIRKDAIGIACKDGLVYLTKIKPFGKKEMFTKDYLNGINKDSLVGKVLK